MKRYICDRCGADAGRIITDTFNRRLIVGYREYIQVKYWIRDKHLCKECKRKLGMFMGGQELAEMESEE